MEDGSIIEGEHHITVTKGKIKKVFYKEKAHANKEALKAIKEADLILFSMGSLFTSIIPNLLIDDIVKEIEKSKAKIMYVCNMMTQPGETDDFTVGDHVELINSYLKKRKIDVVIASNSKIDEKIVSKYLSQEQKDPVPIDKEKIEKLKVELIESDIFKVEDELLRHDSIKLASLIMFYLMRD